MREIALIFRFFGFNDEVVFEHGLDAVFSIVPGPMEPEEALLTGAKNLTSLSTNLATALAMKLD